MEVKVIYSGGVRTFIRKYEQFTEAVSSYSNEYIKLLCLDQDDLFALYNLNWSLKITLLEARFLLSVRYLNLFNRGFKYYIISSCLSDATMNIVMGDLSHLSPLVHYAVVIELSK
jgi:hypothetical protein